MRDFTLQCLSLYLFDISLFEGSDQDDPFIIRIVLGRDESGRF